MFKKTALFLRLGFPKSSLGGKEIREAEAGAIKEKAGDEKDW